MEEPLLVLIGISAAAAAYWYWLWHVVDPPGMSGDRFYMRQMAFTDQPVSPPYCWRPLVPWLARWVGFKTVSYTASLATPILIYFWMGGGWKAMLCGLMFVGNHHLFMFNIRNPEYAEGVGQCLAIATLWSMSAGTPLTWPLMLLCGLCRETLAALFCVLALANGEWFLALVPACAALVAYAIRRESKDNRHPLVEATASDTFRRWIKYKGHGVFSYAHVFQPFRGLAIAVPFMWDKVGDFSRLGLLGLVPIWLLAIPASGQSRIMCYGFGLLLPFVAACSIEWVAVLTLATWFWPIDLHAFDETGGQKSFGFVR